MIVIDEFYTDLVQIDLDLEFQDQILFFHCILFITKIKLFQGTIGHKLLIGVILVLKNGEKVNTTRVLTATLWFWTHERNN